MIVLLDTGVLGQIANPGGKDSIEECKRWFEILLVRGALVVTSEICEYEVTRGLKAESLKLGKEVPGLKKLEDLRSIIDFLPVDRQTLQKASQVWAEAKHKNLLMTHPQRLDVDSIVCGHYRKFAVTTGCLRNKPKVVP